MIVGVSRSVSIETIQRSENTSVMKQALRSFIVALLVGSSCFLLPAQAQDVPSALPSVESEQWDDGATLSHASPNPFRSRTSFDLTVRQGQDVKVEVFNLLGRRVQQLYDGYLSAGATHTITLEGHDLPNGLYLVRAEGQTFAATRQVTLIK